MAKAIQIITSNKTDVLVFVDKIQSVLQKKDGCTIWLEDGLSIKTTAKYEDVVKAITEALEDGDPND